MLKTILGSIILLFFLGSNTDSTVTDAINHDKPEKINKPFITNSVNQSLTCSEQGSDDLLEYYVVLEICYGGCSGLWCCEIVPNPNPDE